MGDIIDLIKSLAIKGIIIFLVVFIVARYGHAIGQMLYQFVQGLKGMATGAQGG